MRLILVLTAVLFALVTNAQTGLKLSNSKKKTILQNGDWVKIKIDTSQQSKSSWGRIEKISNDSIYLSHTGLLGLGDNKSIKIKDIKSIGFHKSKSAIAFLVGGVVGAVFVNTASTLPKTIIAGMLIGYFLDKSYIFIEHLVIKPINYQVTLIE